VPAEGLARHAAVAHSVPKYLQRWFMEYRGLRG
jgi:hypothetical protein